VKVVITGGAGFIGCNLAITLAKRGDEVVLADNLSRPGSDRNLESMLADEEIADRITFHDMDVRDADACKDLLADGADGVAHLAAQVSVTDSLTDPTEDFDINARGTLNVLEALRTQAPEARFLFTSTNKVYGSLTELPVDRTDTRYVLPTAPGGVDESRPTTAATPYGCSKLAGDLYVQDYAKTFGLATTVFRMSCIYGTRQNGNVDQGWVSWLVRGAIEGEDLTIYGDGLQVRDLLHVDDLVRAFLTVLDTDAGRGEVFNMGGGPDFSLSVWAEFGDVLEDLLGAPVPVSYDEWRPSDQYVYISDLTKVSKALDWAPVKSPKEGIAEVVSWVNVS
jgi:CDP-paratose 2-epimerase